MDHPGFQTQRTANEYIETLSKQGERIGVKLSWTALEGKAQDQVE